MRYSVLLILFVAFSAEANVFPEWAVRRAHLADPAVPTVSVPDGADVGLALSDNCAGGCILEFAPGGTYTCGITVGGEIVDSDWRGTQTGVVNPTGPVVFRGDPDDKPTFFAPLDSPFPCFHVIDTNQFYRFEHLILRGRRAEQTNAALGVICDDVDENGICDEGSSTKTRAIGINVRSISDSRLHVYGVEVYDFVHHCIDGNSVNQSGVEATVVDGCGCTLLGECPNIDVPQANIDPQRFVAGRGITLTGTEIAHIGNRVTRTARLGIQCSNVDRCAAIGNRVTTTGQTCQNALSPRGPQWLYGNSLTDCGMLTGLAAAGIGDGIAGRSTPADSEGPIFTAYNRVRRTNSRGLEHSGDIPVVYRSLGNDVAGACQEPLVTRVSAFTNRAAGSSSTRDRIDLGECDEGMELTDNGTFTIRNLQVTGAGGAALDVVNTQIDARNISHQADIVLDAASSGTLDGCTGAGAVVDNGSSVTGDCLGGP